jgi:hypothetical protein
MSIGKLAKIAGQAMHRLWRFFRLCALWIFYGIAAFFALLILAYLLGALLSLFIPPTRDTSRMPEKLVTSATIYRADEIGGFLEGCVMEAYELSPETAAAIARDGLRFFRDMPQPRKGGRYGPWRETPIPEKPYIYATTALNGCRNDNSAIDAIGGSVNYSAPGNYFSITSSGEGILLVIPGRNLVIYGYFG